MKKILIFALCAATVIGVGAQKKVVDQVKKLSGKTEKLAEARAAIAEALQNPETANDANTYFIAGNIEWDAYDANMKLMATNPNDPNIASPEDLAQLLMNGYNYYMKALPLDSLPNEKGQIKPRFSKNIDSRIKSHINDFYEAGSANYNSHKFFPEAYEAFNLFAERSETPDTVRAMGYFYAGVSAYSANQVKEARKAFENAVNLGYNNPNGYIYQVACIENMMKNDSTYADQGKKKILDIAKAGFAQYGLESPFFISTIVDSYHSAGNDNDAMAIINSAMDSNPDSPMLYGLRGWLNSAMGNDQASLEDYGKAIEYPDVDADVLYKAARKYYIYGTNLLGQIDPKEGNVAERKNEIKNNYFNPAMSIANRAMEISNNPSEKNKINNLINQIDYSLSL